VADGRQQLVRHARGKLGAELDLELTSSDHCEAGGQTVDDPPKHGEEEDLHRSQNQRLRDPQGARKVVCRKAKHRSQVDDCAARRTQAVGRNEA
jgi:hypothetical protein